jgi:hypothetical protein
MKQATFILGDGVNKECIVDNAKSEKNIVKQTDANNNNNNNITSKKPRKLVENIYYFN